MSAKRRSAALLLTVIWSDALQAQSALEPELGLIPSTAPNPHSDLLASIALLALFALILFAPRVGGWIARRAPSHVAGAALGTQAHLPHFDSAEEAPASAAQAEAEQPKADKKSGPQLKDPARRDLATRLTQIRKVDAPGQHQHRCLIADAHLNYGRLRTAEELISRIENDITRAKSAPTHAPGLQRSQRSATLLSRDERVEDIAPPAEPAESFQQQRVQQRPFSNDGPGEAVIEWDN